MQEDMCMSGQMDNQKEARDGTVLCNSDIEWVTCVCVRVCACVQCQRHWSVLQHLLALANNHINDDDDDDNMKMPARQPRCLVDNNDFRSHKSCYWSCY